MKRNVTIGKLVGVLGLLFLVGAAGCNNEQWHRKVRERTIAEFQSQRAGYVNTVAQFRKMFPEMSVCGDGGTKVLKRAIRTTDSGTYEVIRDYDSQKNLKDSEVAQLTATSVDSVRDLRAALGRIHRSFVSQAGPELLIPADGVAYGMMYVSPSCARFKDYVDAPYPDGDTAFIDLKSVGDGWFFFFDRR
jgi:hypothetical protein